MGRSGGHFGQTADCREGGGSYSHGRDNFKLFGQRAELVEKADFIPGDGPPAGMKHLYVAANNQPKLYSIIREFAGSLAPQEVFTDENFRVELVTKQDNKVVLDASPSVELEPDYGSPTAQLQQLLSTSPRYASALRGLEWVNIELGV